MNVWLIKDGESLPVQADARRMRTWMLAEELVRQGHSATWWASTHSHQRKALLFEEDHEVEVSRSFRLKLLHAGGYRKNLSLSRLLHHSRLASRFRRLAPMQPRPDVIVSAFPTIELAFEAVTFAGPRGIPVLIDIRDPWPDILLDLAPPLLRAAARVAILPLERKARASFVRSDSLVACSRGFLDWGLRKAGMAQRAADRVFPLGKARGVPDTAPESARMTSLWRELDGKVVFSFVGSFGHVYELELLCDAAERLQGSGNPQIHFVLAGDGEQFDRIRARAANLDNVSAPGWLASADADRLLARSDVGLAPYRQLAGAMPNKIFDYSAAGLPILSSLEGEMTGKLASRGAGLSYLPGDLDALVAHVTTLAGNRELRRQLAAGSTRMFEEEFRAERIYDEYVRHIEAVARARAH